MGWRRYSRERRRYNVQVTLGQVGASSRPRPVPQSDLHRLSVPLEKARASIGQPMRYRSQRLRCSGKRPARWTQASQKPQGASSVMIHRRASLKYRTNKIHWQKSEMEERSGTFDTGGDQVSGTRRPGEGGGHRAKTTGACRT